MTRTTLAQDASEVVDRMKVELIRSLESMQELEFERQVERTRLDRQGRVSWSTSYRFSIEPDRSGGFDERLLEIDNRPPVATEARRHRRKARFENHWREVLDGSRLAREQAAKVKGLGVLATVLFLADLEHAGQEDLNGVACHLIRIVPSPAENRASEAERVAAAASGFFWIARDGHGLVRAEMSIVRPVKVSLMTFSSVSAHYRAVPFDGAWLPGSLEVESSYDAKVVRRRHHNTYVYSHYEARP